MRNRRLVLCGTERLEYRGVVRAEVGHSKAWDSRNGCRQLAQSQTAWHVRKLARDIAATL
jgi:hypothetical protein